MSKRPECPACGGKNASEIYRLDSIPVQSCVLLDSREEALAFPRHGLVLSFCDDCGFIFNAIFDPDLVDYAETTEESQHFSGTFGRFAEDLVTEIASRYDLAGKHTLEIGCGKGDFLQALARRTDTIALGVDPGFIPERLSGANGHDIVFQREYFHPTRIKIQPDFVVCRHTLEHVADVRQFMSDIALVVANGNAAIFFETPDVRRVLAEGAFWDIYFEHCSYFSMGSHAGLSRRAGLVVTDLAVAYDDQYIIQYAEPGWDGVTLPQENDLGDMRALAADFPGKVAEVRERWTEFVHTRHAAGKRVAIWGGGSKGVSFLTTNPLSREVAQVVDINPYKQGKYLPGTGHEVMSPEELAAEPPDTVIVMNPIYLSEVRAQLQNLSLRPELVAL